MKTGLPIANIELGREPLTDLFSHATLAYVEPKSRLAQTSVKVMKISATSP